VRKNAHYLITFFIVFGIHAIIVPAPDAIINIMPLGDSVTRGITGSSDQTGYRRELFLTLTGDGYDVEFVGSLENGVPVDFDRAHEGHSGYTSSQIESEVYAYLETQRLAGTPVDIILLHIGTNDIDDVGFDLSADDVAAILDEIDRYEADKGTEIWVILARIVNRNCITDFAPCSESDDTTEFNDNLEVMAQDRIVLDGDNIHIVDMEDGAEIDYNLSTDIPPGDMWDDLHPFDDGYEKMADLWFSAIQQVTIPTANAGADQTNVKETTGVTLDGSGSSDADGTIVSYSWTQTVGPGVTLSDDNVAQPTFTAPEVAVAGDTLTFELTVTDDDGLTSSSDTVHVTIADKISPVADAGPDQTDVKETTEVTLDGSGSSDADGTIVAYLWEEVTTTGVTITNADQVEATFTAPDVSVAGETLAFQLTVTDDDGLTSSSAPVSVNVVDRISPEADAGADQTDVKETTEVTLDGSGSSDPDGTIDSYEWTQTDGTTVQLANDNTATPSFTTPAAAAGETLTFQLAVTDDDGLTSTDTTSVSVNDSTVTPPDGGGGGGCFIATATDGESLQSYIIELGNINDPSMNTGNSIFMLILFVLCLCAGIRLKNSKGSVGQ
jgi:lysophospholipase L1-like esterase